LISIKSTPPACADHGCKENEAAPMNEESIEYQGPDELREPIEHALQRVVDPEMALSIVEVGLVYRVEIDDAWARVTMTMTSAACPVTDVIVDDVYAQLTKVLPPECEIDVDVVWDPPWTPERLSTSARLFLGW
jgi:metal-sulfur cluster biosynthetic enzyme